MFVLLVCAFHSYCTSQMKLTEVCLLMINVVLSCLHARPLHLYEIVNHSLKIFEKTAVTVVCEREELELTHLHVQERNLSVMVNR